MLRRRFFAAVVVSALVMCAGWFAASRAGAEPGATNELVYAAKGVVKELKPDGRTVVVAHEVVTNFMPAMTMPFEVRNTNELLGLQPGDTISFQMVIAGADAWIEGITKLESPRPAASQTGMTFRLVRDVDPLSVGDLLPEYHFTNETGQAVSTKGFKGQALAFTFIFTRCPYPTFCPLMSRNFEAAERKLLALTNGPTNWHLLSISFDTEHDSPEELKAYAGRYEFHPEHWSFLTGDLTDITALGDQFGEYFGPDGSGGVTHNLRTVVVDARGKVQKIFTNNKWTGDELAAELVKASGAQP